MNVNQIQVMGESIGSLVPQRRRVARTLLFLAVAVCGLNLFNRVRRIPSERGECQSVETRQSKASATSSAGQQGTRTALEAYNRGNYAEAKRATAPIAERARTAKDPAVRKQGAQARWVMAYSAARRKDFPAARERFAQLREEAAALPDHGRQEALPGEHPPTLKEEGAYEHAVLTAALARRARPRPTGSSARRQRPSQDPWRGRDFHH